MKTAFLAAAAVAALTLVAGASAASAEILTATYTGTILSGEDVSGVFGAAGVNLAGDAYVAVYTFDTTKGAYHAITGSPVTGDYQEGGTNFGGGSLPLSSTVTIEGHTVAVSGGRESYVTDLNNPTGQPATELYELTQDSFDNGATFFDHEIESSAYDLGLGIFSTTGPIAFDNGKALGGSVQFLTTDDQTHVTLENASALFASTGTLQITAGGVPEPTTWALMFAGLGLTGATLRRQRRAGLLLG